VDSAPIKANTSMESVVPKIPENSIGNHLKKISEENPGTAKRDGKSVSPAHISAQEHELKRVEKHHKNLRDSPVRRWVIEIVSYYQNNLHPICCHPLGNYHPFNGYWTCQSNN
jgi:hypothetical protein